MTYCQLKQTKRGDCKIHSSGSVGLYTQHNPQNCINSDWSKISHTTQKILQLNDPVEKQHKSNAVEGRSSTV